MNSAEPEGGGGFGRRTLGWVGRRIGLGEGGAVTIGARSVRSAAGQLRVARLDRPLREALTAEPEDPEAEFARMIGSGPEADPDRLARRFRIQALLYLAGGAGLVLFMLAAGAGAGWLRAVLPTVAGPAMALAALRADFLSWRCERRSWDSPARYLRRLPAVLFR